DPTSISAITVTTNGQGQQEYSVSLQILLIMTALSFIPAFVMLMTSFTRIIIVFSILRQALGLQSTPSNQVLVGLAL
ncbi:TPA: flagellar biosynthetic protein FliP, partial [Pseudomonas aeruginosa]|nr:flagellar biosynthetic protein FliP [Pseudomonas aeruginosa]